MSGWAQRQAEEAEDRADELQKLRAELEQVRSVAAAHVFEHAKEVAAIRAEYRDWVYHLARLGIEGKTKDVRMYARRIARKLSGSDTAKALEPLLEGDPMDILRLDAEDASQKPVGTPISAREARAIALNATFVAGEGLKAERQQPATAEGGAA